MQPRRGDGGEELTRSSQVAGLASGAGQRERHVRADRARTSAKARSSTSTPLRGWRRPTNRRSSVPLRGAVYVACPFEAA